VAKKATRKSTAAKKSPSAPRKAPVKTASSGNGRSVSASARRTAPVRPDDFLSHRYVGEKSIKP